MKTQNKFLPNDQVVPGQYNKALEYIDAVKNKMKRSGLTTKAINEFLKFAAGKKPTSINCPANFLLSEPNAPLGGGPGGLTFDPAEMKGMVKKASRPPMILSPL